MSVTITIPRKTFRERSADEATRDVIFLFQRRRWDVIAIPPGYESEDGLVSVNEDQFNPEFDTYHGEQLSGEQLSKITQGEWDVPCALEHWDTEGVFLTRKEGETYGENRAYNYPDGWRVYGVPAEGELAQFLRIT
jgi:hypothetical protein